MNKELLMRMGITIVGMVLVYVVLHKIMRG
jgi:hypothetical protein